MAQFIQRFEKNQHGRDFVVGDIHGEFFLLERKLREIGFDQSRDRLFSVGDLVDRGPRSDEAVYWVMKHRWFHAIKGNHEQLLIDSLDPTIRDARAIHFQNGGAWFYGLPEIEQKCIAAVLDDLPLAIEVETDRGLVGIIHAEVPRDDWDEFKSGYEQNKTGFEATALWKRSRIAYGKTNLVKGVVAVYCGHSYVEDYTVLGNVHCLDTGACFHEGHFTIVQIQ